MAGLSQYAANAGRPFRFPCGSFLRIGTGMLSSRLAQARGRPEIILELRI
jgi:hypothetical protein